MLHPKIWLQTHSLTWKIEHGRETGLQATTLHQKVVQEPFLDHPCSHKVWISGCTWQRFDHLWLPSRVRYFNQALNHLSGKDELGYSGIVFKPLSSVFERGIGVGSIWWFNIGQISQRIRRGNEGHQVSKASHYQGRTEEKVGYWHA